MTLLSPVGAGTVARRRSGVVRWLPWALLVVVAGVALAIGAGHHGSTPETLAQREQAIASQVRCPVCEGETVAESQAAESVDIRAQIRRELIAGESPRSILAGIVAAFGPGVLEKPGTQGIDVLLWAVPVAVVVVAAAGLIGLFAYWRPRRAAAGVSETDRSLVAGALDEEQG